MHPADEQLNRPGGLAERLYSLRKAAGLKVVPLATQLGWPPSKVSKLQNGHQLPTTEDVIAWATACGRPEVASELLDMLAQVQTVHWQWQHRLPGGYAAIQDDLDKAVRQATSIRVVEMSVIPGMLQTPDYAREVFAQVTALYQTPPEDAEPAVTARMRRQEALYDARRTFQFIIAEHVLYEQVGEPQVMLGQMDRLLTLSALGNITIAILPQATRRRLTPGECFMVIDGRVSVESWASEIRLTPSDAAILIRVADLLLPQAATGDQARAIIAAAAAHWQAKGSS